MIDIVPKMVRRSFTSAKDGGHPSCNRDPTDSRNRKYKLSIRALYSSKFVITFRNLIWAWAVFPVALKSSLAFAGRVLLIDLIDQARN